MVTRLSLESAAELLGMKPAALRIKAKRGEVPGAKPGKEWVFLEEDIVNHIRKLYLSGKEHLTKDKSWQQKQKNSIKEIKAPSGGVGSRIQELRNKNAEAQRRAIEERHNAS